MPPAPAEAFQPGRAARLIPFRLTNQALSGYVIGIDTLGIHGEQLAARLVDVFELRCAPPA